MQKNRTAAKRYLSIDLLRILLALWVTAYHLSGGHGWFKYLHWQYPNLIQNNSLGALAPIFRLGFVAVPVFFMISGYIVTETTPRLSSSQFLINRFSRILPSFWLSVFVAIALSRITYESPYSSDWQNWLTTSLFSWQIFNIRPTIGSYWTLIPEIQFYLLIALLLSIVNKYKIRVVSLANTYLILTIYYLFNPANFRIDANFDLLKYGAYFLLGAHLSCLQKKLNSFYLTYTATIFLFVICLNDLRKWIFEWDSHFNVDWPIGVTLFAVTCILLRLRFDFSYARISSKINLLGKSSYLVYLLQETIGMPLSGLLFQLVNNAYLCVTISTILILILSLTLNHYFEEKMILKIRSLF